VTALKRKTKSSYRISHDMSFAQKVMTKLFGRETAFKILPEDRSFEMSPTLRCRLGDNAFACFFFLDDAGFRSQTEVDVVADDITQNYALNQSTEVDTLILVVTKNNFLTVSCGGQLATFKFSSQNELLQRMEKSAEAEKIRAIAREITPTGESGEIADRLAEVLESGSFDQLNRFVSSMLSWGAKVGLPKTAAAIAPINMSLYRPISDSRDHILLMEWPQSIRGVAGPRAAHRVARQIMDVFEHNDKPVGLVLCYDGKDAVLMAPGESADLRIQLHRSRLREKGWVRNSALLLTSKCLPINNERRRIDHRQLLHSRELDARFNALCADFRLCMIRDLLATNKGLIADCLNYFRKPGEAQVKMSDVEEILLSNRGKQGLFISTVDSVVLRTIVRRFIEVYHSNPFDEVYDSILDIFGESYDTPREDVGFLSAGKKARFSRSRRVKPGKEAELKKAFIALGNKYRNAYGGDMHFSRIAAAVDYLEDRITAQYLAELLDITNAKRYQFRYEDLRPDALEEYYQRTLETAIQLKIKGDSLVAEALESRAARKELGAFFTPAKASALTVKMCIGEWLDEKYKSIKDAVKKNDWESTSKLVSDIISMRVVDPTVGGASFLKQAFKEMTRPDRVILLRELADKMPGAYRSKIAETHSWFSSSITMASFEAHVIKNCLYGVDIDFKSLTIGAYTLNLESLCYMEGSEKFPTLLNRNLKHGNALVNWLEPGEWKTVKPEAIKKLLTLRKAAARAAPEKMLEILEEEATLCRQLIQPFALKRQAEWGVDPDVLSPFCWELEFPEAFYDDEGRPLSNPGFTAIVGNPPWENLKGTEAEFFESIDGEWPKGKNASKEQAVRQAELLKTRDTKARYQQYFARQAAYAGFLDNSAQYQCLDPKYESGTVRGGNGDPNTYKLAIERFLKMNACGGCFGIIVPEGIASDKGNRDLRRLLVSSGIRNILGFTEKNDVFIGVAQSFAIVTGHNCGVSIGITYTTNHAELLIAAERHRVVSPVPISMMRQFSLAVEPFVALDSKASVELLTKFIQQGKSGFKLKGYRELDTTKDMDLADKRSGTRGYHVIKGDGTGRFLPPDVDEMMYGLDLSGYRKRYPNRAQYAESERIVWHNVSNVASPRRMKCLVVPPKVVCFHSLNVVWPESLSAPKYYCAGMLNSFCFEWLVRLISKNNNISMFIIEGLPLPNFERSNPLCGSIDKISKDLHSLPDSSPKRIELEARLEASAAHVFGLSTEELEHVLSFFPKVEDSYKERVLALFDELGRRKRVA
jgi:Alw26I/Eco31I/Esp3I family type II restriction m6 adenine DNA methyltransferase